MKGESGNQRKLGKQTVRLLVCHLCGRRGGTLVKDGDRYKHQGRCR